MQVTTLSGTVENGVIRLAGNVQLPENTPVYVIVPAIEILPSTRIASPRLRDPKLALDFQKDVIEDDENAGV